MRNLTKYALLCGCILALSASCDKNIEPSGPGFEVDESAPISFSTGVVGTKGLLDGGTALAKEGTTLQVYDYLSEFSGTINGASAGYYIDNSLTFMGSDDGSSSDGQWQFPSNRKYYWTKTGTHKFFGWLTVDGNDDTNLTAANLFGNKMVFTEADQTLELGPISMTPQSTQFDFSYSDIETRDASVSEDRVAVPLKLNHLFTALAVNIKNETGVAVTNVSVTFTNVYPEQSATIDWGSEQEEIVNEVTRFYPEVVYEPSLEDQTGEGATEMEIGTRTSSIDNNATKSLFGETVEYRLLWPQAILQDQTTSEEDGQFIVVTYDQSTKTYTAALNDAFKNITALEAGKKYLLTITITSAEVIFNVQVDDLTNMNDPDAPAGDYEGEHFYFES